MFIQDKPREPALGLRRSFARGAIASALALYAISAPSCSPSPASDPSSSTLELSRALPEEVIAFGGSDDIQAWLFRAQSYVQGAQPSLPPFALMLPSLVASGLGLTLPQVIDLSGPARWLIASPRPSALEAEASPEPIQHSPYLKVTPPKKVAPWRGVVALKLRAGIKAQQLSDALASAVWSGEGARESGEELHAEMQGERGGVDEGHLILKGGWLFIGNDLALLRACIPNLLTELRRPLSKELSLSARLEPLQRYLTREHPERMKRIQEQSPGLLSTQLTELATLELRASAEALGLTVSARHKGRSPLYEHRVDGAEVLKRLPRSTGGFVLVSSSLPAFASLLEGYRGALPETLFMLRPPPKLGVAFSLNEQLELSGLVTGGGEERGPWLSALLRALRDGLNAQQATREAPQKNSSGPASARDAVLIEDSPLSGRRVEALRLFKLLSVDDSTTSPTLSRFNAQLSELRLLSEADASYVTFGPKSRPHLELWQQLKSARQLGLEERADLSRFQGELSSLLLMLYLAPPSVDRALGQEPVGRPQDPQGREGISVVAQAKERQTSLELTIPVGVAARLVKALSGGGPLDISKGRKP